MAESDQKVKEDALATVVAKPKVEVQRRTISPYDLSSSDNPGYVISQPLLRGSNYDEWATNIRLALKSRKKFGFVDGTIPRPTDESGDLEDWWTNNALVVSWIKLTIEAQVRSNLSPYDVAKDLWEHIQKRFSVKNGSKIGRVKAEIASARQKGMSIEAYFGHMTKLWTTLNDYRQPKTCRCGQCKCNLAIELAKERDEDRVHEFLRGLDEVTFGGIRSSLMARVPFPSMDDVYNVLTQEEDSKVVAQTHEDRSDGVSFAVRTFARNQIVQDDANKNVTCTACGRVGHPAESCFRMIGYPPWWGDRPRNRGSPATASTSNAGRGRGFNVRGRASEPVAANIVQTVGDRVEATANAVLTSADRVGFTSLNNEQWGSLVQMLEERRQNQHLNV